MVTSNGKEVIILGPPQTRSVFVTTPLLNTGCGGLTLAGCQVPTNSLHHSPPQLDMGEKIGQKARELR